MAKFRYAAIRNDGVEVSGTMEGADRSAVIRRLNEQGQHAVDVAEQRQEVSTHRVFSLGGSVASFSDISIFTRELAWLLRAGMSLNNALEMLMKESFSSGLTSIISDMRTAIRKGRSFHEAMAETGVFSPYYVSMIEVGEASGTLAAVLERISISRDREQKLRGKLGSALAYPSLLVVLALGAITFIMISVVPSIKDMITGSGVPIPDTAQFVIGMSDWLIAYGMTLLIVLPVAALAIVLLFGAGGLKRGLKLLSHYLPFIGSLMKKGAVVQFCRVLGTLLAAGVSLPDSLKLMRPSLDNREMEAVVERMEIALRQGEDFLAPLAASRFFPSLLARMLHVGNETGNLTPSVLQVTTILEEELDRSVDRTLTLLEPAIILALSAAVAFIIVSLMSAIISINDLAI